MQKMEDDQVIPFRSPRISQILTSKLSQILGKEMIVDLGESDRGDAVRVTGGDDFGVPFSPTDFVLNLVPPPPLCVAFRFVSFRSVFAGSASRQAGPFAARMGRSHIAGPIGAAVGEELASRRHRWR